MDAVVALAGQAATVLGPALPYLVGAGQKVAEGAAKKLEAESWGMAQALWAKLQPKVEARPVAQEAVKDAAANPTDPDVQAALRVQLRKLLQDDRELASEVDQLLKTHQTNVSTSTATTSGERSVAVGRDVTGGTIVTGDGQPRPA
jgi:uncharacterized protein YlxW (UPF0749 family)